MLTSMCTPTSHITPPFKPISTACSDRLFSQIRSLFILLLPIAFLILPAQAQTADSDFSLRSVRVSIGTYQPSFGYFDRTAWDFSGGSIGDVSVEYTLIKPLSAVAGIGYFSTASNIKRGDLAYEEQLVYDMIPLSLGLIGRFSAPSIRLPGVDSWNLYANPSADLFLITASYRYCVCTPESVRRGTTLAYSLQGGAEFIIGSLGLNIYTGYRLGKFEQSLQFNNDSAPTSEGISLDGLMVGVRLAFLF